MTTPLILPRSLSLPGPGRRTSWGRLVGAGQALATAELARQSGRPVVLLAEDPRLADRLEAEIRFFADGDFAVEHFVEWETLPWDGFSPHQDIVSQRLHVLSALPSMQRGVVIAASTVLHQRLPPVDYVSARSLSLRQGQSLPRDAFSESLAEAGYLRVPQVTEHGEFAVRGSLIDVFPMGTDAPVRIDFFDDDIESLRRFSVESQISAERLDTVSVLPAREVPLDADAIRGFRGRYRERFEGQPGQSRVYREVSDGIAHGGIEYYLPLFFDTTASFADYLPRDAVVVAPASLESLLERFWAEARERYELCSLDRERPILGVSETFWSPESAEERVAAFPTVRYSNQSVAGRSLNFDTRLPPAMKIEARYEDPAAPLMQFLGTFDGRVLFSTDSPGRREQLIDLLSGRGLDLARIDSWQAFHDDPQRIGVAVAPVENGVLLPSSQIGIISERQLFGERTATRRRRRRGERDPETIIRQLDD
ncbi:MAG: transcription-repair coupling factor, partial [Proteobacteria bacterium]|nr:transcription-repair coupling factor [Pseudomonadota bacterium]